MRLIAYYLVPRGEVVQPKRLSDIISALSRCQLFYLRQAGLFLNWRLAPSPILGRALLEDYQENPDLLLEEVGLRVSSRETEITGIFFEGRLPEGAFGGTYGEMGYFLIAAPYLSCLKRYDSLVAHELGHALGLPDSKENFSIMGAGWQLGGLERRVIFPRHKAHLKREDRARIRRQGWI